MILHKGWGDFTHVRGGVILHKGWVILHKGGVILHKGWGDFTQGVG